MGSGGVHRVGVQKINGALKVLAFLLNVKDEVTLLRISQEAKMNYKTVRNAIEVLKKYGLINERYEEGPPPKRLISLTEKGREAAEYAKKLLEVIGQS